MKTKKQYLSIIIIATAIILFAGYYKIYPKKIVPPEKTFGLEYFPIKQGITYEYSSNIGDLELTTEQDGNSIHFKYDNGKFSYHQYFTSDKNGIYMVKVKSKVLFFGSETTYNKPLLRIPFPLTLTSKWNWDGIEFKGNDQNKIAVYGEVLGEETLDTKAGKFYCIKIKLVITSADGANSQLYEWLAPNVGIIKEDAQTTPIGLTGMLQKVFGLSTFKFELVSLIKN